MYMSGTTRCCLTIPSALLSARPRQESMLASMCGKAWSMDFLGAWEGSQLPTRLFDCSASFSATDSPSRQCNGKLRRLQKERHYPASTSTSSADIAEGSFEATVVSKNYGL